MKNYMKYFLLMGLVSVASGLPGSFDEPASRDASDSTQDEDIM
jgi:hypothetical protein